MFVSALTGGRLTGKIYTALLNEAFTLILSRALFEEVLSTLSRPIFELTRADLERVTTFLTLSARWVQPSQPLRVCRDPSDDKLLECALAAQPSCLVTGDRDLLTLHPFHGIPIVSPRVFVTQWLGMAPR